MRGGLEFISFFDSLLDYVPLLFYFKEMVFTMILLANTAMKLKSFDCLTGLSDFIDVNSTPEFLL